MTAVATQAPTDRTTPPARRRLGQSRKGPLSGRIGIQVMLWLYAVHTLTPLLLMVSDSLRTQQQMVEQPLGLPTSPNWSAYSQAWIQGNFGTYIRNSVLITVTSVLLSTALSLLAAYPIARSRKWLFGVIEAFFMSGLMLPVFLAILPIFFMLDSWGLISNPIGLILVYAALGIPFSTFVLTSFFRQLPVELEEAARVDGAGPWRTFWHVLLPLVRPAIATVVVFRFVPVWNDFFFPIVLLRQQEWFTIPVGLTRFFGEHQSDFSMAFAGLTIATVPLVLLFIVATKQIVAGLTAGMSK